MRRSLSVAAALASLGAAIQASPAAADKLLTAAPGGVNLAAGHGYIAWAHPAAGGGWALAIRDGAGAVSDAPVPTFGAAPDPAIGVYRRRVVIAYSRCEGNSSFRGCDIWAYDVQARIEHRVRGLATHAHSETAPDVDGFGRWSYVQRDGTGKGIYTVSPHGVPRRLSRHTALETAVTESYVIVLDPHPYEPNPMHNVGITAYRRHPLHGSAIGFGHPGGTAPHALTAVGDRAFWLDGPGAANSTISLDPAGRGHRDVTAPANYALPPSTNSIAASDKRVDLYLDAEGVKAVGRRLYG